MGEILKEQASSWLQKLDRTKIVLKVGKISAKDNILTVQDESTSRIGNKTKRSLETNQWQREIEARRFKVSKMRPKKRIEK